MFRTSRTPVDLHAFLMGALLTRQWGRSQSNVLNSQIGLDIAIYASALRLEGRSVPTKTIHLSIGYSIDRVREVLHDMTAQGLIEKAVDPADRRIRRIQATDKLLSLMRDYSTCANANRAPRQQPHATPGDHHA